MRFIILAVLAVCAIFLYGMGFAAVFLPFLPFRFVPLIILQALAVFGGVGTLTVYFAEQFSFLEF